MKTQETWIPLADFTDIKLVKTEDGVGKVTINRPEVRNAFRPQTVEELKKAFEMLREDPTVGVVILTGEGPMKGFTADAGPKQSFVLPDNPVYMDVSEEILAKISKIYDEKVGERKSEISSDKLMILLTTLFRFYSANFVESAEFRQETLKYSVDALVKLALPEK